VKRFSDEHGEKVKMVLGVICDLIKTVISMAVDNFQGAINVITDLTDFVTAVFKGDWESAINAVNNLFNNLKERATNIINDIL
jgi:phage-related protein